MDKLAVGAWFKFSPISNHPGFIKVSNFYSRNLVDGKVYPNCSDHRESGKLHVVYLGRWIEATHSMLSRRCVGNMKLSSPEWHPYWRGTTERD